MNRALLALMAITAALAGCQRESNAPTASSGTRSMGAASARASAPARAPTKAAAPLSNEDVSAGRNIAAQGAPGAAACASCHGANGEGNPQAGFPRLAGLGRLYIEHQLSSFADGTRPNPVMTPIAGALSAQQRGQVAGHFAQLGGTAPAHANAADTNAPVLVVRGDDTRGVQACVNCHGPQGIGDAAANPYLAGQHETYLTNALAAWKDGTRHNDPSGQMPAIAKSLTDAEAKAIVAYYAGLPPPTPRNAQAVVATGASSRPTVQSGPAGAQQGSGNQ